MVRREYTQPLRASQSIALLSAAGRWNFFSARSDWIIVGEAVTKKARSSADLSRPLLVGGMRSSVIIHRVKGGKTYGRANNPRGAGARYSFSQDACTRRSRHGGR